MARLPSPDEIAALLPEELAPYILTDLAQIPPNSMDRGRLNIGNYCNGFDGDIHGPMRSLRIVSEAHSRSQDGEASYAGP